VDVAVGLASAALGGAVLAWLGPSIAAYAAQAPVPASRRSYAVVGTGTSGIAGVAVGLDPVLPAYLLLAGVAAVLAVVDVALHRLPDRLTLPSYAVGAVLLAVGTLGAGDLGDLGRALAGAVVAFGAFVLLHAIGRSGLGAGDVKYAGVLGMHLAWFGWPVLALGLVGAFVVGGLAGVVLMMTGRARWRTRVAFGPAMITATLLAIVVSGAAAAP
jgi:leader peptidase (prepilin peptidase)/N-methyltransferase